MRLDVFPSHFELIRTFFSLMLIDEVLFMCLHGIMHEVPAIYHYHKVHHEYKKVASFTALYLHPIEEMINLVVSIM